FTVFGVGAVGASAVGAFVWFVLASGMACAVKAGMGLCSVIGVCTYSTDRGVLALFVVVSKPLAVFALVGRARLPVLFDFVLSAENADSISEEAFKIFLISHSYNTRRVTFLHSIFRSG